MGLLGVGPTLFNPPSPVKRIEEAWNERSAFVFTVPSVHIFKTRVDHVWAEVFPHLPNPNSVFLLDGLTSKN